MILDIIDNEFINICKDPHMAYIYIYIYILVNICYNVLILVYHLNISLRF